MGEAWEVIEGDCRETLKAIPAGSVQCCVTSPPYFGLRSYLPDGHPDKPREVGGEPTPGEFVAALVGVFGEVRRVLADDGTLWLNLGDSYNAYNGNRGHSESLDRERDRAANCRPSLPTGAGLTDPTLKPKDLIGVPWMVAFALRADGWHLRAPIPWVKRNAMPESVTDRPASAMEYVFLLTKSGRYYYDGEAVKVPGSDNPMTSARRKRADNGAVGTSGIWGDGYGQSGKGRNADCRGDLRSRRNSDWFFESWQGLYDEGDGPLAFVTNVHPFKGAHFATFPPKLVEPMIRAGCPEGGLVLDPFCGAGTVGVVATRLGRRFVGLELSPEYAAMARARIRDDAPLFNAPAPLVVPRIPDLAGQPTLFDAPIAPGGVGAVEPALPGGGEGGRDDG